MCRAWSHLHEHSPHRAAPQGTKTSLRYALQMISSSHLLARRRHSGNGLKTPAAAAHRRRRLVLQVVTEVADIKRSYDLFADAGRSRQLSSSLRDATCLLPAPTVPARFLDEYQQAFALEIDGPARDADGDVAMKDAAPQ